MIFVKNVRTEALEIVPMELPTILTIVVACQTVAVPFYLRNYIFEEDSIGISPIVEKTPSLTRGCLVSLINGGNRNQEAIFNSYFE